MDSEDRELGIVKAARESLAGLRDIGRLAADSDPHKFGGVDLRRLNEAIADAKAAEKAEADRRELEGLLWAKVGAVAGVAGVVIAVVALVVAILAIVATMPGLPTPT